ncbi:hypothetical protein PR202_gb05114 [Eleusine coracana subsp. coracana]|uniref:chitinase n=1 Tax=Eleusine coracana subsp. coracana TaxID=191504 RepID=A0AAV5E5H7_ELECO|nr:hypothetical protein PR202_gb05114 [Eleusine coracana subsp. coracana]
MAGHCDLESGDCVKIGSDITTCQSAGVKVLLSIGGGAGGYNLSSPSDAQGVATYLWDHFLGGTSRSRPFGSAVLDGIDFDIQTGSDSIYFDRLAKNLASLYQGAKDGRTYLLTAAPQCPFPDASIDTALRTGLFDHMWVQFYNNPPCQYASSGDVTNLRSSWEQWTRAFPSASIFLGLPASAFAAVADGYIPPGDLTSRVLPLVKGAANYGGIMLWNSYYDSRNGYSAKLLADPPIGSPVPGASGSPSPIDLPVAPSAGGPLPKKSSRTFVKCTTEYNFQTLFYS